MAATDTARRIGFDAVDSQTSSTSATYFVDRNVAEGRGDNIAIECGDQRITYRQVLDNVNRFGNALRDVLDVRIEERVAAVAAGLPRIRLQLLRRDQDRRHSDSDQHAVQARRLRVPPERLARTRGRRQRGAAAPTSGHSPRAAAVSARRGRRRHARPPGTASFDALIASSPPSSSAEPTSKDDAAFWLYSSGSTGSPKGCVHLHHDMVVCTELYARGVLGITEQDRCFSVAKLFFAYGLGNALYFPFGVGATTILFAGHPRRPTCSRSSASTARRCSSRCRPTTRMLLAHEARVRLLVGALGRLGRRGAAARRLRALSDSASA